MLVYVLDAQLEAGGKSRVQNGLQTITKRSSDLLRADQVKLGWFGPMRPRKVDRIKVDLFQLRQAPARPRLRRFRRLQSQECGQTPGRSAGDEDLKAARG